MRRPHIKNSAIALTSLALALSLTSCGAGPNASTRLVKQVTDGVEANVTKDGNDLVVSNFLLVAMEDGSAVVVGTIINQAEEADALLGISAGGVQANITGLRELKQNTPVRFEGEVATSKAVFEGVGAQAGRNVTVQLAFARAGIVTVTAIIRDKRDDYANVTTGATLATSEATE
jgi:hypothetical protein